MRHLPLPAIVLLGILLLAPTATLGFYADDYVHQLVLRGDDENVPMEPWALYDFGTRADWTAIDGTVGTFPWWTGGDWKIRFLRPLASLYLLGQHAVFGEWALGYHLVGLAVFGVLLVLVHGLYRTLGLSEAAARIGTLLFAVCDSVVLPVGWPANQNSLLAAVFSVASFRLVVRGSPSAGRLAAGLLLAVAAAGSKESGSVALVLAVLVLFARSMDPAQSGPSQARRLRAAGVAALLLSAGYVALFVGGGYGTRSLFYATPWGEPTRYATNLLLLCTAGPASLLGPFPLDLVGLIPAARVPVILFGCLVGIPIWIWILRGVRSLSGAGWLAIWSVAFLVVQAGTLPADRLLFLPAIGALGLLALCFEERRGRRSLGLRVLAVSTTFGSALFVLVQGLGLSAGAAFLRDTVLHTDVGPTDLGHRDVFVLQTESQFQAFTLHSMWGFHSTDHELTFWNLQAGNRPLEWTRVDDSTFDLETLGEPFLTGAFETVYLTEPPATLVGDTWNTRAFQVEALAVEDGRPTHLRFRLEQPLAAETVRFVRPEQGRLARIDLPQPGETVTIAAPVRAGPYMP